MNLFGSDDPDPSPGMKVLRGYLSRHDQELLVLAVLRAVHEAPFYYPTMRNGTPFRVQITSCGLVGWTSDEAGYRYVREHPETKRPWPEIPERVLALAKSTAQEAGFLGFEPDTCLANLYRTGAKLGVHRDDDEKDKAAPIVSVSLGDSCVFRFGGASKNDPFTNWKIHSGDVVVFGGPSRLAWHGLSKIVSGSSDLVPGGGRLNLTIRKAL